MKILSLYQTCDFSVFQNSKEEGLTVFVHLMMDKKTGTFFKIYFVFYRRKKNLQVWNNVRMGK